MNDLPCAERIERVCPLDDPIGVPHLGHMDASPDVLAKRNVHLRRRDAHDAASDSESRFDVVDSLHSALPQRADFVVSVRLGCRCRILDERNEYSWRRGPRDHRLPALRRAIDREHVDALDVVISRSGECDRVIDCWNRNDDVLFFHKLNDHINETSFGGDLFE